MDLLALFTAWPWGSKNGLLITVFILGIVFSIWMLVDCLRRQNSEFKNPLTREAQYDKLIWSLFIVLTMNFYFIGAIVYLFVIKQSQPEE